MEPDGYRGSLPGQGLDQKRFLYPGVVFSILTKTKYETVKLFMIRISTGR